MLGSVSEGEEHGEHGTFGHRGSGDLPVLRTVPCPLCRAQTRCPSFKGGERMSDTFIVLLSLAEFCECYLLPLITEPRELQANCL